jgi:hypothetical protein
MELRWWTSVRFRGVGSPTGCKHACQILLDTIYQNERKYTKFTTTLPKGYRIYQMTVKYSNDHKIYQHFPFSGPPKFTQIGIFGLKTNHLATLAVNQFDDGNDILQLVKQAH